jgi:Tol biopolymer transport system component
MGAARDRFGAILPIAALVVVLGAVALRLFADEAAAESGERVAAPATAAPSPGRDDETEANARTLLADVSLVDVRTGRETPIPRSIRKIGNATQFQVSPDGRMLTFVGGSEIYVARVDGSHIRDLTPRTGSFPSSPSWSPDGSEIVVDAGSRILVVHVSTGDIREILDWRKVTIRPVFSADGRDILFTSDRGGRLHTWSVPAAGGRPTVTLPYAAFAAMSPDGTSIAYRRTSFDGITVTKMTNSHIFVANPDGRNEREIGAGGFSMSQIDPEGLWPSWSPDGSRIVFQRDATGLVQVADLATGYLTRVGEGGSPTWLDDDTIIVESFMRARRADP